MGEDEGAGPLPNLERLRGVSVSRRGFLGGASLSVLGGVLARCGPAPLGASHSPQLAGPAGAPAELAAQEPGGYVLSPHTPYALSGDVVLSEDHYLLKLHQIDPVNDIVMAYSRNDGEVEALLLQEGSGPGVEAVLQVYRDPTTTGGWNTRAVPNTAGATDMVAGMAAPTGWDAPAGAKQLQLWYRDGEQVVHVSQDDTGTWTTVGAPLPWPSTACRCSCPTTRLVTCWPFASKTPAQRASPMRDCSTT